VRLCVRARVCVCLFVILNTNCFGLVVIYLFEMYTYYILHWSTRKILKIYVQETEKCQEQNRNRITVANQQVTDFDVVLV